MTKQQRISLARIISDMIKADNIIEEREIRGMKHLMDKYGITKDNMSDARGIRFSDAVNRLKDMKHSEKREFFDDIYALAMSDNACVQREALLMLALKYCLIGTNDPKAESLRMLKPSLISCPIGESTINEPYIVYVESEYCGNTNNELCDETLFQLIVTKSSMYGFNFIYIPKLVDEFQQMDKQYVTDVISYMDPKLKRNTIDEIYNRLRDMTTENFFKDILYERLNVKINRDIPPSLLINIGTSVVPYCISDGPVQYYTEFLCIPIYKSIKDIVEDILNYYKSKVSIHQTIIRGHEGHFKYFGFYKALFDFLIAPPPIEPDLVFAGQERITNKYEIIFKYNDKYEKRLPLPYGEYTILYKICKGGFNRMIEGQKAPEIARLKGRIKLLLNDVINKDKYLPYRQGNIYKIPLDKRKIFERIYDDISQSTYSDKILRIR